jgi:D-alanyl-D-alanine carboxypeptidase
MKKITLLFLLLSSFAAFSQKEELDKILYSSTPKPFSGVVLIAKNKKIKYFKAQGFTDVSTNQVLNKKDKFFLGSLSKQITAVQVLRAADNGLLSVEDSVIKFIPDFAYADVKIKHLLSHKHGISGPEGPKTYETGTSFAYSDYGYHLLSIILEKIYQKPFAEISHTFFNEIGLKNTSATGIKTDLVVGIIRNEKGDLIEQPKDFSDKYVAGGLMISTASDLLKWNRLLHLGKLLKPETYTAMTTGYSIQNHKLMGEVDYGYGIRISRNLKHVEIGHTGYAAGFITLNYFYPATKTSVIILENLIWNENDLKEAFYQQMKIKDWVDKNQD